MADGGRTTESSGRDAGRRFHVVVLGTGPVGKTSLINALLGRSAGETGATIGTTAHGRTHTHAVEGVEGTLLLTDTPGLGEPGDEGDAREAEAIDLAIRADLLVFVVDQDLARADHRMIGEMAREGKRLIVALNKKDRLTEEDREAILAKLRERLAGLGPGRGRRGGRRRPVAGPGPRPQARRDDRDHPGGGAARPGGPGGPGGGDPRSRGGRPPRRQPPAPRPPARAGRAGPRSPRSAASGPRRSSSGTSGWPP